MTAKANTIFVPASPPGRMTEAHFTRLATLGWTYAPTASTGSRLPKEDPRFLPGGKMDLPDRHPRS